MDKIEAFGELGVSAESPLEEVRHRYRTLIKSLHPDAAGTDETRVTRVIEAYRTICERTERPRRIVRRQSQRMDTRAVFTMGRWATAATDPRVRLHAVQRLRSSDLHAALVFLRQAMFDSDLEIAASAAAGFVERAGASAEQTILECFTVLSVSHRLVVLGAMEETGRYMKRLLAYAAADPDRRVREFAARIREAGGRPA